MTLKRNDILILIPAAGASSRMGGRDKLLEEVDGEAMLARLARAALETGARVLVALAADRPQRAEVLAPLAQPRLMLQPIDGREGMAVAIRAAVALADTLEPRPDGLMILPADMPELEAEDLAAVIAAFARAPGLVHRASAADGRPGHPVILPRRLFPALAGLRGDEGARALLKSEAVELVPVPGERALVDLDTPQDWADWRAGRHGSG